MRPWACVVAAALLEPLGLRAGDAAVDFELLALADDGEVGEAAIVDVFLRGLLEAL